MEELKHALEEHLSKLKLTRLTQAAQELSTRYRSYQKEKGSFMSSEEHRLAYLATRMPATAAAVSHVLSQLKKRVPVFSPQNFLDIGAGPGTGMWALVEQLGPCPQITCLEKDEELITWGQKLAVNSPFLSQAIWKKTDLEKEFTLLPHDLILISYVMGELKESLQFALLEKAWEATTQFLILIEPGTPIGFQRIRFFREQLIQKGAYLIAPCPHRETCPIAGADWCHFSERVQRSSLHRLAKSGELGYEDEKFSYLIVSKQKKEASLPRIVRHPQKRQGHVELTVCTERGMIHQMISKKHKENYRDARKSEWGDEIFIKP